MTHETGEKDSFLRRTPAGWELVEGNSVTSYSHLFNTDGVPGVVDDILQRQADLKNDLAIKESLLKGRATTILEYEKREARSRAEIARLREALENIARFSPLEPKEEPDGTRLYTLDKFGLKAVVGIAKQALTSPPDAGKEKT